jgi:Protein of unknown function (DUF3800)
MLHLFLDDSGKESQQTNPWVCMAGYLADHQTLLGLYGKWSQLLIRHGISEIHMKQLIPMTGQYKNLSWDVSKRDGVIQEFIEAINETNMWGLGVAVEVAAWRRQKAKHPKLDWGTIQEFCVGRILRRTASHLDAAKIDNDLAIVFDTDPEFGASRFNMFCALMGHRQELARRLSSITFGHPTYYPGLQCADLLVWETRKELMQKREGYESTRRWRAMLAQMPNYHLKYVSGERWSDASFEDAASEIIALFSPSESSSVSDGASR